MNPIAAEFLTHFTATLTTADAAWQNARFVVLDTEMTSLDSRVDRLVSIGAIACVGMELTLDDAFEAYIRISHNTSAVHIHGITRELAESEGAPEPVVLQRFLDYLRDGVIVGHHVDDDLTMLELACQRCFDLPKLPNLHVDTMDLAVTLEQAGLLERLPGDAEPNYSLDGLCQRFGIAPHDRHTAMGDAFLTGQVFLRLLRRAARGGQCKLEQLMYTPAREAIE
ncbi:MAG TPA: 3'-5' exonuclease [Polyangiaceae bacterium]